MTQCGCVSIWRYRGPGRAARGRDGSAGLRGANGRDSGAARALEGSRVMEAPSGVARGHSGLFEMRNVTEDVNFSFCFI